MKQYNDMTRQERHEFCCTLIDLLQGELDRVGKPGCVLLVATDVGHPVVQMMSNMDKESTQEMLETAVDTECHGKTFMYEANP